MEQIKHYFAGSNSSEGFYSLYPNVLENLERLFILKGGPGTGKSTLIKKIGQQMTNQGYSIDYIHCSFDENSLDGLIVPALKAGIVDGTAPHIVDPKYPGVIDKIVNLGDYRNDAALVFHKDKIVKLADAKTAEFANVYQSFAEARNVHEEKESIYIDAMDFNEADRITEKLAAEIFVGPITPDENPLSTKQFFGAATPNGPVHFIDNLTADVQKRYIIKGRSGSGKSTLMRRIGKQAEDNGLCVDYYHCAFHPASVDMIVIPTLKVAIIDGTAPHVINPTRAGDEIVDMFELCIDPQVEVDRKDEIEACETKYKQLMKQGTQQLAKAKSIHDEIESYYIDSMDFDSINDITDELADALLQKNKV